MFLVLSFRLMWAVKPLSEGKCPYTLPKLSTLQLARDIFHAATFSCSPHNLNLKFISFLTFQKLLLISVLARIFGILLRYFRKRVISALRLRLASDSLVLTALFGRFILFQQPLLKSAHKRSSEKFFYRSAPSNPCDSFYRRIVGQLIYLKVINCQ